MAQRTLEDLQRAIEKRKSEIRTLERARDVLGGGVPLTGPQDTETPGACAKAIDGGADCSGEVSRYECEACGFIAARCNGHGGQTSAKQSYSAHCRHHHPRAKKASD